MSASIETASNNSPITKELLEELTGCQVVSFLVEDGSKLGDGYMSLAYSVIVDLIPKEGDILSDKEPLKETRYFLFKCFPLHPARQRYLARLNVFYSELSFYKVWVKALRDFQIDIVRLPENELLTPAFPPFVGGKAIDFFKSGDTNGAGTSSNYTTLDNFIVMTNLKKEGFRMTEKADGLDLDHLTLAFTELAKEHALSWAYKNKVEWDVLKKFPFLNCPFEKQAVDLWVNIWKSRIDTAAKTMDTVLGEGNHLSKSIMEFRGKEKQVLNFFLEQNESSEMEAWKMHRSPPHDMVDASKNEGTWLVQVHGDVWSNNLLFKYNEAGKPERVILLDFQLTHQGCPTVDLAYLVYTATTSEFRKAHLDSLLQLYCDKFTQFCDHLKVPVLPGFSFTSLKWRFHRAKVTGYMLGLLMFPIIFMESSSEVNMEQSGEETGLEEMLVASFEKKALESSLYKERLLDLAQEMYDDGVI